MTAPQRPGKSPFGAMLLAVTLLATGAVLTLGWRYLSVRRMEAEALAGIQSRNLALAVDDSLTGAFQRIDQALGTIAGVLAQPGPRDRQALQRLLALEGKLIPWPGLIWIADAQGRAIMGTDDIGKVPPWQDRWWFQHCRANPQAPMVVAKPVIGFLTRAWVVPCVRPYTGPEGQFAGVVVIPLAVDYLQGLLAGYDLGQGGTLSLRDADGGFIGRYPAVQTGDALPVGDAAGSEELHAFVRSGHREETHFGHSPVDRIPRLYTRRRLRAAPLMVGAGLAEADYLAQWRRDRSRTLAAMALSLVGIWTVAGFFRRSWRRAADQAQALALSEARFRHVSSSMLDLAYCCERLPNGEVAIDWMIGAAPALLGRSIEEIIAGRCWGSLVLEEDRPVFRRHVFDLLPGQQASCELRLVKRDGTITWFASFARCEAPDQEPARVYGALLDITERKRAELAIRDSEAKLNLVLNSTVEAIVGMDQEGRCTFFNAAFLAMTGHGPDAPLGRNLHQLIHHTHADGSPYPEAACPVRQSLYHHQAVHTEQDLYWRADGSSFPAESWSQVQMEGDRATGVVLTFVDTTERQRNRDLQRKLAAELDQMQKLDSLGKLAGGVAHDMNNVLAAIQAVSELQAVKWAGEPALVRAFGIIEHATHRGRDLVRGLTNFARKDIREAQLLDLNTLVGEEMEILRSTTKQRVALELDLEEPLPPVLGEKGVLGSALMNLCVNALDAMPQGGTLTLRTRALGEPGQPDQVALEVADSGTGMTPDVLAKAMEPFFTTKGVGKGTGLGLSSVYATAKAHGGTVTLQSAPGAGTTVRLLLPAAKGAPQPGPAPQPAATAAGALHCLLVDDDDLIRTTVPPMLALFGHRVTTAAGGEEALALLAGADPIDLVILDLNMPGMNGLETLRTLRATRADLPVLLATGHLDSATVQALEGDGHALTLTKPFTLGELSAKLRALAAGVR